MAKEEKENKKKIDRNEAPDIGDFGSFVEKLTKDQTRILRTHPEDIVEWFSAYNVATNMALSGHPEKGIPRGRIINFEGDSDTGKTLFALTVCREAQIQLGSFIRILIVDAERGTIMKRLESLGLFTKRKPKNSKKPKVDDGEDNTGDPRAGTLEVIQVVDIAILTDHVIAPFCAQAQAHPEMQFILLIDSVSMLETAHEMETTFGTRDMQRAQDIRKMMRLLNAQWSPNITAMLIYHLTTRIAANGMLSSKTGNHNKDINGGTAAKFAPSVRLEISYDGKERRGSGDNETIIGQGVKIEVIKSRIGKPMIRAATYIDHNTGFTRFGGLADQLEQLGIVIEGSKGFQKCPPLFGDKQFRARELELEIEKEENARKVVHLIAERMTVSSFGEGKVASVEGAEDDNPEDMESIASIAAAAQKAADAKRKAAPPAETPAPTPAAAT